jgi:hypothetical protein
MGKSHYSEAYSQSAGPEITRLLWNQKFHYYVQKSLPLDPILSHLNSLHTLTYF